MSTLESNLDGSDRSGARPNDGDRTPNGINNNELNNRKRGRSSTSDEDSDDDDADENGARHQRRNTNAEAINNNASDTDSHATNHATDTPQQRSSEPSDNNTLGGNTDVVENSQTVNNSDPLIPVSSARPPDDPEDNFDLNNAFMEQPMDSNRTGTTVISDNDASDHDPAESERNIDNEGRESVRSESESSSAIVLGSDIDPTQGTSAPILHIDLEAAEQQVVEIPDEELEKDVERKASDEFKAARDYKCPICFDPPTTALITQCGHVFCCECLFHMVNSSRASRGSGYCAMCRSNVTFRDVRLVVLRKKRVKKA